MNRSESSISLSSDEIIHGASGEIVLVMASKKCLRPKAGKYFQADFGVRVSLGSDEV
jgi:hypothetical protein